MLDSRYLSFGIIGCSRVAYRSFIPGINSSRKAKLSAIGSRSTEKARNWSKQFGCEIVGSYEDVLKSNVDAVYISLPVGLHEEWVTKAANAGKHIICEKSASTSFVSTKRMIDECKRNNTRIIECFPFRFHPQHSKVRSYIDKGKFGEINNFIGLYGFPSPQEGDIRLNKDLGGGALNDAACYPISASRMIYDSEPVSVASNLEFDKSDGVDIRSSAFLVYPNNRTAFVAASFNNYYQSTYTIWGTKASMSIKRAYAVPQDYVTSIYLHHKDKVDEIKIPPTNQFQLMIDSFCEQILGIGNCKFDFEEDMLAQAKVMEAVRLSHFNNRPVFLEEIIR